MLGGGGEGEGGGAAAASGTEQGSGGASEGGRQASGSSSTAAAAAGGAARPAALPHKNDLVVWLRMQPLQRQVRFSLRPPAHRVPSAAPGGLFRAPPCLCAGAPRCVAMCAAGVHGVPALGHGARRAERDGLGAVGAGGAQEDLRPPGAAEQGGHAVRHRRQGQVWCARGCRAMPSSATAQRRSVRQGAAARARAMAVRGWRTARVASRTACEVLPSARAHVQVGEAGEAQGAGAAQGRARRSRLIRRRRRRQQRLLLL